MKSSNPSMWQATLNFDPVAPREGLDLRVHNVAKRILEINVNAELPAPVDMLSCLFGHPLQDVGVETDAGVNTVAQVRYASR